MSWWRRSSMERLTRAQIDEAVRLLHATAAVEPGGIIQLPGWLVENANAMRAFNETLPYVREDIVRRRYQLQADGIYLTSN